MALEAIGSASAAFVEGAMSHLTSLADLAVSIVRAFAELVVGGCGGPNIDESQETSW
ncbi:hypothetical protein [Bradyrhizobium glycinis]|uniref:hypothetical protein n=1 Tax=Bradyrhizobium glycinis TaxID=2751812 RepID=UPI0018D833D6|nr:hypothetical protein [Bradyrhizobium glycinis]MBH5372980.1 hypothetical protein [Bradyrhizobium glycinis]